MEIGVTLQSILLWTKLPSIGKSIMSYVKSVLKWVLCGVEVGESVICTIALLSFTLLVFVQVINRYLVHLEIRWLSDLALYIFIFFIFIAAAVTTWREGHVAIDFLRERVMRDKPTLATIYRAFLVVLSVAILSVLLPLAYQFMLRAMKYPEYGTLGFNTSWLQMSLFFAMALVLLHLLIIARRDITEVIRDLRHRSREE